MHFRKATSKQDTKVKGISTIAHLVRNLWLGNPSLNLSAEASVFLDVEEFTVR